MGSWRNRCPELDEPGTSSDSRSNFQHHRNYSSSLRTNSSRHFYEKTYVGLRREKSSFFKLEDLIELSRKDSSEIILELIKNLEKFSNFLKSNLESDCIVLTIAMLSKVCSTFFKQNKLDLLRVIANAKFLRTLENFVRNLKYDDRQSRNGNKYFWNNPEEFLNNLHFVCESIIEIIPTEIVDILQKLLEVVNCIVPYLSQKSRKTKNNFKILIEKLDLLKKQSQSQNGSDISCKSAIDEFRRLSACFTWNEISTWNCEFTTTGTVEERYIFVNVEHYLEAHSRIMMERFVALLKDEIGKCTEHYRNSSINLGNSCPIRIYPDVFFGSMVYDFCGVGVILKFSSQESAQDIFSQRSKIFKSGSTLCFTQDNFLSGFIGWVITKDFKQKRLIIGFENDSCDLNGLYMMAEYNISFENYYNNLKALQCMSDADFPMESYLINAVPEVERPNYLDLNSSVYTIQSSKVDLFGNKWPTADQLQLDSTQYTAFKAALTQKFVMIQGASGSGKTYLGLKIVKTLLHNDNQRIWYNETPILIVCLSNQVLDTFLEGLIPTTRRIVRVGYTKSEKLENFTLSSARKIYYTDRDEKDCEEKKLKNLVRMRNERNNHLNLIIDFHYIILLFKSFESFDNKFKTSWFSRASDEDHLAWLFDELNEDLHSIEISEVMKQITEEKEHITSMTNNTIFDENSLPESRNLVLFSKLDTWLDIEKICNQVQEAGTPTNKMEKLKLETQLKNLWRKYQYFKMKMNHREFSPDPAKPINVNYQTPHSMNPNDRWNLYFYWLNLLKLSEEKKIHKLQSELRQQYEISTEKQNIRDIEIIKRALILGMTVNTAIKMQSALQTVKCRIVVVQEASYFSESYTVLSLTKHCEHLILMGDQQMINLTSVSNCNRYFNTGSSIMERMLHNKVQCNTLGFQHRMRPEISQLLAPFYPKLKNHHSVTNFPIILGIPSSIFFVNYEQQRDIEEYNSKTNVHEGKFLINLARYLRQVGYAPEDIIILAAFSGQMHVLDDEKEKYQDLLKNVKVRVVDTYQGEECKIILLSLVRNNKEGKIGCLKIERFINLALSRAKEALYMTGNIDLLCENSEVWRKVKEVLVEQNCLKNYLPVCCKINSKHVTEIKQPEDFDQVPEKNCSKICGHFLNCGHSCCKPCHGMDGDHTALSCTELCKM